MNKYMFLSFFCCSSIALGMSNFGLNNSSRSLLMRTRGEAVPSNMRSGTSLFGLNNNPRSLLMRTRGEAAPSNISDNTDVFSQDYKLRLLGQGTDMWNEAARILLQNAKESHQFGHPHGRVEEINTKAYVEKILRSGGSVNDRDQKGRTPLTIAVINKLPAMVAVLLTYNPAVNNVYKDALYAGNKEILDMLMKHGVKPYDIDHVVHYGHEYGVIYLLNCGVKVSEQLLQCYPWVRQLVNQKINKMMCLIRCMNQRGSPDGIGVVRIPPEMAREIARHVYLADYRIK